MEHDLGLATPVEPYAARMDVARELRMSAAFLALISWSLLVRGIYLPPTSDPELDLEAGHGFGVFVALSLPGMAITVLLLVWALWGVRGRGHAVMFLVVAASVTAFGFHVRRFDELLNYVPGLERWSWIATVVGLIAAAMALAAWIVDVSRAERRRAAESSPRSDVGASA